MQAPTGRGLSLQLACSKIFFARIGKFPIFEPQFLPMKKLSYLFVLLY
jgi:hypothetical protein